MEVEQQVKDRGPKWSPLYIIALISFIMMAGTLFVVKGGEAIGFIILFLMSGLFLLLMNYIAGRFFDQLPIYWSIQLVPVAGLLAIIAFNIHDETDYVNYKVSPQFSGMAVVVYGISGHSPIDNPYLDHWEVLVPDSGYIITSSDLYELPYSHWIDESSRSNESSLEVDKGNFASCVLSGYSIQYVVVQDQRHVVNEDKIEAILLEICQSLYDSEKVSRRETEAMLVQHPDSFPSLEISGKSHLVWPDASASNLKKIVIEESQLSSIPMHVLQQNSLQKLDLNGNRIKKVGNEISVFQDLEVLDLSYNGDLNFDNADLSAMVKLDSLDVRKNFLVNVPYAITSIPDLKYLDISENSLEEFKMPDNVSFNLNSLVCESNRLIRLGDINRLEGLKYLQLAGNLLDSISNDIAELDDLEYLDLRQNPIKHISPEITKLKKLKRLILPKVIAYEQFEYFRNNMSWCKVEVM